MNGNVAFSGKLNARVIRAPGPGLRWKLRNALRWEFVWGLVSTLWAKNLSKLTGIPTMTGALSVMLVRADGRRVNYGIVGRRVITTAFVNFVVDQLVAESSAFGDFKHHDSGVGTTAAAIGDTDMQTTDGESRVSGTQGEGTNPNEYVSVGTISYTTTKAITEHGLFNAATSGVLMDRHVFSAINVVNGDSIQFSYTLVVNSGG